MTVTSRWVRYPVAGTTLISSAFVGERGKGRGTDNVGDSFTLTPAANQIKVNLDSLGAQEITLTSGTTLDPRFVARDIERKLQALEAVGDAYKYANCEFSNYKSANGEGHFVIKSGSVGASSTVAITAGTNDARSVLGLSTVTAEAGTTYHTATSTSNTYAGTVTTSGTYGGMFDEEYYVVTGDSVLVTAAAGGGNTYAGTMTIGGDWNYTSDAAYTVTISTTNGEVMNAGTGSVPTFTATDAGADPDAVATAQELLYSDYWYYLGEHGGRMKFTDAQFGDGDTFTVTATKPTSGNGAVGVAEFVWTSNRGDDAASASTSSTSQVSVGTKGVTMAWQAGTLTLQDAWRIVCRSPVPEAYGVTNINYGNVTVTTASPVKVHQFEISSGATTMSNVKFSLYSHGTFSHHDAGDLDTKFHFGTVGADNRGELAGVADSGVEWYASVAASDIENDKTGGATGTPTFLWAAEDDLAVVASADSAEDVGNIGLVSDLIYTSIKLGANETGSNSSIVHRLYFDYS